MINTATCTALENSFASDDPKTVALKNTNLTFVKGEFTAIIGPSESEKLLSLLGILDKPSKGITIYA